MSSAGYIVECITAPYESDHEGVVEDCHLIPCADADEALDALLFLRENPTLRVRIVPPNLPHTTPTPEEG